MMSFSELWRHFRLLSEPEGLPPDKAAFLEEFLRAEYARREQKRIATLLRMSGIRRVKLLHDFDWAFNPNIPREKIMEFMQTGSSLFQVGKFLKPVRVSDRALFHERHGPSSISVRVGPTVEGGELSVRCREATSGHRAGLSPGEPFSLSLLRTGGLSGSGYGAKELAASELLSARSPSGCPGAADPVCPMRGFTSGPALGASGQRLYPLV